MHERPGGGLQGPCVYAVHVALHHQAVGVVPSLLGLYLQVDVRVLLVQHGGVPGELAGAFQQAPVDPHRVGLLPVGDGDPAAAV